jgi:hypothetical protein
METNYSRMTIKESGDFFCVFKLKPHRRQYATGGGYNPIRWFVPATAKPKCIGTYAECMNYITTQGAIFMSDHGLPLTQ